MSFPVIFRDLATEDVRAIHSWYELQQEGLGPRFVASLDLAIALISQHPLSCPVVYRHIRRVLLHGFPYAVFYLTGATDIVRGPDHPVLRDWRRETPLETLFAAGVLG